MTRNRTSLVAFCTLAMLAASPVAAKDDAAPSLAKCESPLGTIAITDGDQQGWTQFNLSSPRPMLGALIEQSGCFTLHNAASGRPADFLLSAVVGSKEEIDKSVNLAKGALTEGLVRSGAAGQVLAHVPMGGALFSAFSRFGGKKKTVSAGLRIMSPMTGQTLASGSGESSKSFVKIMDAGDWSGAGSMGGYASSSDGKMLTGAFVQAFNAIVSQRSALVSVSPAAGSSGSR
ncbi:MAG: penicillin-binding protein activator LpoB [Alphaproteobacteria bacterium]|nr:penicillin-binding protein activator LpoB [Alphaproteobacteria bacterium]MDB5720343.1 penicillin-binding protein activator LpoB [Alphaproteobacteria bacterium]